MKRYIVGDGRSTTEGIENKLNELYQQGYKILNVSTTFLRADYNGSIYDYVIVYSEGD